MKKHLIKILSITMLTFVLFVGIGQMNTTSQDPPLWGQATITNQDPPLWGQSTVSPNQDPPLWGQISSSTSNV